MVYLRTARGKERKRDIEFTERLSREKSAENARIHAVHTGCLRTIQIFENRFFREFQERIFSRKKRNFEKKTLAHIFLSFSIFNVKRKWNATSNFCLRTRGNVQISTYPVWDGGWNVDLAWRYKKSLCNLSSCCDVLRSGRVSSISGREIYYVPLYIYTLRAGSREERVGERGTNKCIRSLAREDGYTRGCTWK